MEAFLLGLGGAGATTGAVASALGVGGLFQAGAFLGTTFLGQALLSIGLNTALNAVLGALTPRPQAPEPSARMANFAQPVSYAEWPVGRCRKGGPLGFTGFKESGLNIPGAGAINSGKKRHYSVILAACPIEGVVTHYLDERQVTLNINQVVDTEPMVGLGRIRVQDGTANVADEELVLTFPEVTNEYDFAGLAVAHLWAKRPPQEDFTEAYPNGREWAYAPLLDGAKEVYDPRGPSTGWTRNLALNTAYWLTTILGRDIPTSHDWWDMVATEADACDVVVTNGDGGLQPKWRLDGIFSDDEEYEAQRSKVALAGDVWFYERKDGLPGFKVGRYEAPTITLTEADLFQTAFSEGFWGRNAPSEIAPQYSEPGRDWREAPAGTLVLDATARQVKDEPTLYMVASHNQACRCAKRIAAVKRAKYKLQATVGLKGFQLIGERFVRVQALGIDQVFEIQELWRNEGSHTFDVVAQSVEPTDFDFNAALEEPTRPTFDQVLSEDAVEPVLSFAGTAVDGGSIRYTWAAADPALEQQLRFREALTSDWTTISVPSGQTAYLVSGLADGVTYEAQIRNRTPARRVSDWSVTETTKVVANSTPPGALTAFATAETTGTVTITFTAPNDANYYATRIYRADYTAGYSGPYDIGDAVLIRTEYGIPSNADSYDDTGLTTGHYAYWGVPINASGVEGAASGPSTEDVI